MLGSGDAIGIDPELRQGRGIQLAHHAQIRLVEQNLRTSWRESRLLAMWDKPDTIRRDSQSRQKCLDHSLEVEEIHRLGAGRVRVQARVTPRSGQKQADAAIFQRTDVVGTFFGKVHPADFECRETLREADVVGEVVDGADQQRAAHHRAIDGHGICQRDEGRLVQPEFFMLLECRQ